jgi:YD repeat-containing protein
MGYDQLGHKVDMHDPDMGHWAYSYDGVGNLESQTDSNGAITTLQYDELNRLTNKTYSDGTPSVTYVYDEGVNGKGHRTSMVDAAGTVTWSYDGRGRLLSESRQFSGSYAGLANPTGSTYDLSYTYDAADRVRTMTYPDGETITTNFDERGLPENLQTTEGGAYVVSTAYDVLARLTQLQLGNGLQVGHTYYAPGEKLSGDIGQGGRLEALVVISKARCWMNRATRLEANSLWLAATVINTSTAPIWPTILTAKNSWSRCRCG